MKLDETKLQEVVEKIAYQQFGAEQIDDLWAKMGILNDYVQKQLLLFAVVGRSEQLKCEHKGRRTATELVEYCEDCKKILFHP